MNLRPLPLLLLLGWPLQPLDDAARDWMRTLRRPALEAPMRIVSDKSRAALVSIAWDASRQKRLGARALRETYRRVIRSLEFDPAGGAADSITIDEEMVKRAIAKR